MRRFLMGCLPDQTVGELERNRVRDRATETEPQHGRDTERQRYTETEWQSGRVAARQRDRETERQRDVPLRVHAQW